MTTQSASLGEIIINACDSYLDVSSCRGCSRNIFSEPSIRSSFFEDLDTRQDMLSRVALADMGDEHSKSDLADGSIGSIPIIATEYGNLPERRDDSNRRTRSLNIFRLDNGNSSNCNSETSVFIKLCRCSAWSQDSIDSHVNIATKHSMVEPATTPVRQIHWDQAVPESKLLNQLNLS